MARQKPVPPTGSPHQGLVNEDQQNNDSDDNVQKSEEALIDAESGTKDPTTTDEGSEDSDADWKARSAEEWLKLAKTKRAESKLDRAIDLFGHALKAKLAEKDVEYEGDPAMAIYWLEYGDALLRKEEESGDLFHKEQGQNEREDGPAESSDMEKGIQITHQSNEQTAWEALELARVCFAKSFQRIREYRELSDEECWNIIKDVEGLRAKGPAWISARENNNKTNLIELAKNAQFCRIRLGDYCQADGRFSEAAAEFFAACRICFSCGLPTDAALQAAVPLALNLLADEAGDKVPTAYHFCIALCGVMLEAPLPSGGHLDKEILSSTKQDLELQLAEYEKLREGAREMVKAAIQAQLNPESEAKFPIEVQTGPVEDLGVVGRKKRKLEVVAPPLQQKTPKIEVLAGQLSEQSTSAEDIAVKASVATEDPSIAPAVTSTPQHPSPPRTSNGDN